MPLENGVTIRDLVEKNTLNRPYRYVQSVLENMADCQKQFGSAIVRLGLSGEGRAPHYRISPKEKWHDAEGDGVFDAIFEEGEIRSRAKKTGEDPEQRFAVFHGAGHTPLDLSPADLRDENWSDGTMGYEDIARLRNELRMLRSG